jgi:hypothetical protein
MSANASTLSILVGSSSEKIEVQGSLRSGHERRLSKASMTAEFALVSPQRLVHLSPVDLAIIIFYFALVLAIGFYLKQRANTSEDYFHGWARDDRMDRGP